MSMSASSGHGVRSEINITPLVDVVLVLLVMWIYFALRILLLI